MNSYERYTRLLSGKEIDFLPRTPILMQFAAEYIGSNYAEFAADYKTLVKANLACARDFGIDQLSCISDPYRETAGFGGIVTYRTDGPPDCTHPLRGSPDLSLLKKPDPLQAERMRDRIKAVRLYRKETGRTYSVLGWIEGPAAEAADLRGVTEFLIDLMDNEKYAGKLMDLCVNTGIEFAKAQIEAGADTVGIGDAIASQVSPDIYMRLIAPREKVLVDTIHKLGAYVKLHICGDITHLLPEIGRLNVDILDVDHMVSLSAARSAVGADTTLSGNIDPVSGVLHGTPEFIENSMHHAYKNAGNPYIINAGCEIPSRTPNENLQSLCLQISQRTKK